MKSPLRAGLLSRVRAAVGLSGGSFNRLVFPSSLGKSSTIDDSRVSGSARSFTSASLQSLLLLSEAGKSQQHHHRHSQAFENNVKGFLLHIRTQRVLALKARMEFFELIDDDSDIICRL